MNKKSISSKTHLYAYLMAHNTTLIRIMYLQLIRGTAVLMVYVVTGEARGLLPVPPRLVGGI